MEEAPILVGGLSTEKTEDNFNFKAQLELESAR